MHILWNIKWPSIIAFIAFIMLIYTIPANATASKKQSLLGILPPERIHGAADGVILCEQAIAYAENQMGIPSQLLHAIALGESGRGLPKDLDQSDRSIEGMTLWPWTVMGEGRGRYLQNKFQAIKEVQKLKANDVSNIDVGCMQVNLHYHGHAFDSLQQAFDPIHNVAYAATFLTQLRHRHGSWTKAVKYYHSGNAKKNIPYSKKIISLWRELKVAKKKFKKSQIANRKP